MNLARCFLPELADRQRLPVALLSGFLGSGKTTLLNVVLRDPRMRDTAVAINEFGAVPIDHSLIEHGADKTVVLANGCLCCTVSGDLEGAVMRIFSRRSAGDLPSFSRLIVEPSGLADPAPLAQAILRNPSMSRVLRLDGITTVVDALFGPRQLDEHEQASKQVMLATTILLSKTDLAPDVAALLARLKALNPVAPVVRVQHGRIDPAALFSPHFLDPTAPASAEPMLPLRIATAPHAGAVAATVLTASVPLPWPALESWLRGKRLGLADQLLRLKGIAQVSGSERPIVLQGIHHVLHPPVALDRWPGEERGTQLVFLTRGVDEASVREGWDRLTKEA
jgi:G3E family GTPase